MALLCAVFEEVIYKFFPVCHLLDLLDIKILFLPLCRLLRSETFHIRMQNYTQPFSDVYFRKQVAATAAIIISRPQPQRQVMVQVQGPAPPRQHHPPRSGMEKNPQMVAFPPSTKSKFKTLENLF